MNKLFFTTFLTIAIMVSLQAISNSKEEPIDFAQLQPSPFDHKTAPEQFSKIQDYIMKQLSKKSKQYPKKTLYLIQQGWMNISMGKFEKAVKNFNTSITLLPTSSAYMGLGMAYNNMGENEKANKAYMTALSLKPEKISPYTDGSDLTVDFNQQLYRSRVLGIHDRSIEELYKESENVPALKSCFKLLLNHKYDRALKGFEDYLDKHPDSVNCLNGIGYTYNLIGLYSKADNFFAKALKLDSKSATSFVGLGKVELNRRNYEKANEYFDYALKINPNLLSAHDGKLQALKLKKSRDTNYKDVLVTPTPGQA